jgi:hypothetical protein
MRVFVSFELAQETLRRGASGQIETIKIINLDHAVREFFGRHNLQKVIKFALVVIVESLEQIQLHENREFIFVCARLLEAVRRGLKSCDYYADLCLADPSSDYGR